MSESRPAIGELSRERNVDDGAAVERIGEGDSVTI
jgi:hypothetical protein